MNSASWRRPIYAVRLLLSGLALASAQCIAGCSSGSGSAPVIPAAPVTIVPGAVWSDTSGRAIQAHGGGMLRVGDTWYWYGEDKTSGQFFQNVNCYSSTDLGHWTFVSHALSLQPSGDLGPERIVELPRVIFNAATRTFVMWMHIDKPDSNGLYIEAKVGVATSTTPGGPYTYLGSFQPSGHQSRDMNLFEDTDGAAYLIYEDRTAGLRIARLSADYQTVEQEVALAAQPLEAPALAKIGGVYYLLASQITGWDSNPNKFASSASLAGPWSDFRDLAPPATNTYNSQTTFVLPVQGTKTTSYLYIGERWNASDLGDSRYIWMPLAVQGATVSLPPDHPWTLSVQTGEATQPAP